MRVNITICALNTIAWSRSTEFATIWFTILLLALVISSFYIAFKLQSSPIMFDRTQRLERWVIREVGWWMLMVSSR